MLNVAVVGIGWWGKTLVPLLKRSNKLRVVKIVEVNVAAVADFARTHGVEVVSDYAEVLKDPAIQGVVLTALPEWLDSVRAVRGRPTPTQAGDLHARLRVLLRKLQA